MASDTDTAKSDPPREGRRGWLTMLGLGGSRIGRTIIALNFIGLAVLIVGALTFNEMRRSLLESQREALTTQGEVIVSLLEYYATQGEPEPVMSAQAVRDFIGVTFPRTSALRARVFDAQGNLIVDSYWLSDTIEEHNLPLLRQPGGVFRFNLGEEREEGGTAREVAKARRALENEVSGALQGNTLSQTRSTASGERVTSVSLPIVHVKAVLGVLTLQVADVNAIVAKQRLALIPFILIAIMVTLTSSLLLNRLIAEPVRKLARAADQVRLSRARSIAVPEVSRRDDELGDLGRSLTDMTDALSERMDAIDRFAADVAHEIRNPLTSIRSAVETLELVKDQKAKDRLAGILKQDVSRLDRLITDISNASRLDAELSRDQPRPVDIGQLVGDIVSLYGETPPVRLKTARGAHKVNGREGPLGQVYRNLIDNARSFTNLDRPEGEVRVSVGKDGDQVRVVVEDDGPGIPPENIETIFERFYTSRPKSVRTTQASGLSIGNSGLGLSIARQIITAHGGRLWAENRLEGDQIVGARFIVALPAAS